MDEMINKFIGMSERIGQGLKELDGPYAMLQSNSFFKLLEDCEKLAVGMREYSPCFAQYLPEKLKIEEIIKDCSNITYDYIDDAHIILHLPVMPRKRKNAFTNARFIWLPLSLIMQELREKYSVVKRKDRFVVFVHKIAADKLRRTPDYDNQEISIVINALTESLLVNDSPECYSLMHCTKMSAAGESSGTDVHILFKEAFEQFVLDMDAPGTEYFTDRGS